MRWFLYVGLLRPNMALAAALSTRFPDVFHTVAMGWIAGAGKWT
jgi:hypothetical protein